MSFEEEFPELKEFVLSSEGQRYTILPVAAVEKHCLSKQRVFDSLSNFSLGGNVEHDDNCKCTFCLMIEDLGLEDFVSRRDHPEYLCTVDGNALCITKKDFENLQESPAVFVDLTPEQIKKIRGL